MPDLQPYEIDILRRSVAMLLTDSPNGLSREKALALFEQIQEVTDHRDRLIAELVELGNA